MKTVFRHYCIPDCAVPPVAMSVSAAEFMRWWRGTSKLLTDTISDNLLTQESEHSRSRQDLHSETSIRYQKHNLPIDPWAANSFPTAPLLSKGPPITKSLCHRPRRPQHKLHVVEDRRRRDSSPIFSPTWPMEPSSLKAEPTEPLFVSRVDLSDIPERE